MKDIFEFTIVVQNLSERVLDRFIHIGYWEV